jgi:hypothetical protein
MANGLFIGWRLQCLGFDDPQAFLTGSVRGGLKIEQLCISMTGEIWGI